ncbi:hypothetical protein DDB_G0276901 [Dictyostelium discoideum AX4]|uniref:Uncharacterized protein n=1 Tax=Dictyostelium discoideum TaxID=44689 RepID=Q86JB4_DICDI|nr:hypothetical protein DDB_G0276901 [Dictyostelium discoideum AX4]EAL68952.1 hypothetical protein DDB_G0276901 [Dictyostelium discoideum AX4]|eukprot:XP_642847.1 hypothetical protein DDB_G0276901 [Dictyostelium discoideum AX4]
MIKNNVNKILEIIEAYLKQYTREFTLYDNHLLFYRYLRNLLASSSDFDKLKEFIEKGEFNNLPMDISDKNEIKAKSSLILSEIANSF